MKDEHYLLAVLIARQKAISQRIVEINHELAINNRAIEELRKKHQVQIDDSITNPLITVFGSITRRTE